MKGEAENDEGDEGDEYDEDEDDEELLGMNDIVNERVTIWDEHAINEWAHGGVATRDWVEVNANINLS
jgi:hypothetical protein